MIAIPTILLEVEDSIHQEIPGDPTLPAIYIPSLLADDHYLPDPSDPFPRATDLQDQELDLQMIGDLDHQIGGASAPFPPAIHDHRSFPALDPGTGLEKHRRFRQTAFPAGTRFLTPPTYSTTSLISLRGTFLTCRSQRSRWSR
jgi:hypothetical protein